MTRVLVGTAGGLFEVGGRVRELGGGDLTAGSVSGGELWAIGGRQDLLRHEPPDGWARVTGTSELELSSLLTTPSGVWVGTEEAHLLRLAGDRLERVEAFEDVEGRETWFTPWGGPPAVRSLAVDLAGRLHANVHVGGIPRSTDAGATWEPTIEIDADVHQVIAHPTEPDVVLAAGAVGLCLSEDGGATWRIERDGLHATYARAAAVAGATVLLTVSDGPRGGRAAAYRTTLGPEMRFERCTSDLPEWFDRNIDSGWLAADGAWVAFATSEGDVFISDDAGRTWSAAASGLPAVRWVAFG